MPPRTGELTKEYEAIVICGYCKKEIPISDDVCKDIMDGKRQIYDMCPEGHISYNSSMKAKFSIRPNDWRFVYGSGYARKTRI